jgi:hypothetical protein
MLPRHVCECAGTTATSSFGLEMRLPLVHGVVSRELLDTGYRCRCFRRSQRSLGPVTFEDMAAVIATANSDTGARLGPTMSIGRTKSLQRSSYAESSALTAARRDRAPTCRRSRHDTKSRCTAKFCHPGRQNMAGEWGRELRKKKSQGSFALASPALSRRYFVVKKLAY